MEGFVFSLPGMALQPCQGQFAGGGWGTHQVKLLVLGTQVTPQVRLMPTSCCPLCQAEVLTTKPTLDPGIQAFSIPDEVYRDFTESDKITS